MSDSPTYRSITLEKLETFVTYSSRDFTDWSALDHVPSVDIRA